MYRVTYISEGHTLSQDFEKFETAALFVIKLPKADVLEIKYYDNIERKKPNNEGSNYN